MRTILRETIDRVLAETGVFPSEEERCLVLAMGDCRYRVSQNCAECSIASRDHRELREIMEASGLRPETSNFADAPSPETTTSALAGRGLEYQVTVSNCIGMVAVKRRKITF
jgi:hypothetical protein